MGFKGDEYRNVRCRRPNRNAISLKYEIKGNLVIDRKQDGEFGATMIKKLEKYKI